MLPVASRIDAAGERDRLIRLREFCHERGLRLQEISCVTGEGLDDLKQAIWSTLEQLPRPQAADASVEPTHGYAEAGASPSPAAGFDHQVRGRAKR
jgi:hypothetical protein